MFSPHLPQKNFNKLQEPLHPISISRPWCCTTVWIPPKQRACPRARNAPKAINWISKSNDWMGTMGTGETSISLISDDFWIVISFIHPVIACYIHLVWCRSDVASILARDDKTWLLITSLALPQSISMQLIVSEHNWSHLQFVGPLETHRMVSLSDCWYPDLSGMTPLESFRREIARPKMTGQHIYSL